MATISVLHGPKIGKGVIAASCTVVTSTLTPVYKCGKNSALHCRDMQLVLDAAEKDGSAELGVASYESATP
eukprot:152199-Rhodomonas_salina.2